MQEMVLSALSNKQLRYSHSDTRANRLDGKTAFRWEAHAAERVALAFPARYKVVLLILSYECPILSGSNSRGLDFYGLRYPVEQ